MSAASSPARPAAALGLIALAAVSWGTTGAVTTLLVSRAAATPLVVGAGRMLVAAVLLLAAARLMTGAVRAAPGDGWRCLALGACMAAVARPRPRAPPPLTFAVAAVLMAPAFALRGAVTQLALGWAGFLYLGAVTTAGAYALYTAGLRSVSASAAGVASLLEPLTATLLGVMLFGERLDIAGWAGAVLLLGALVLLGGPPPRRRPPRGGRPR